MEEHSRNGDILGCRKELIEPRVLEEGFLTLVGQS